MYEAQQLSGDVLALPVELRDWMVLEMHRRPIPWGQVNDIVVHLQSLRAVAERTQDSAKLVAHKAKAKAKRRKK